MKASNLVKIIPEFALAAACCRWPPSAERNTVVARAAARIDWTLFSAVVERHRVAGLVWPVLREAGVEVPQNVRDSLAAAAGAIAAQNLMLAAASIRLNRAFEEASVPILFVKGISLGQLAYRDISLKAGWDVDILVPPERIVDAAAILEKAGFGLISPAPPLGRERLSQWHEFWKESIWCDGDSVHVELHTRLADNRALIPGIDWRAPRQDVAVMGHALPTLRTKELFAYLCVHGASSGWFRLKWIADLAALVSPLDERELERLYRESQRLGASRAAAQALLLAAHLFETKISANLARELRADAVNRWLFSSALKMMAGRTVATELHDARFGTAPIHLMQLSLLPGLKFKLSEAARQLVAPEDRIKWPLPRALQFLYPAFRVLRPFDRRLRRTEEREAQTKQP